MGASEYLCSPAQGSGRWDLSSYATNKYLATTNTCFVDNYAHPKKNVLEEIFPHGYTYPGTPADPAMDSQLSVDGGRTLAHTHQAGLALV